PRAGHDLLPQYQPHRLVPGVRPGVRHDRRRPRGRHNGARRTHRRQRVLVQPYGLRVLHVMGAVPAHIRGHVLLLPTQEVAVVIRPDAAPSMKVTTARFERARTHVKRRWRIYLLTFLALAGGLIMITPFVWAIVTSLQPRGALLALPPQLVPTDPTITSYTTVVDRFPFLRVFGNSVLVAVLTTLGQLVVCSM